MGSPSEYFARSTNGKQNRRRHAIVSMALLGCVALGLADKLKIKSFMSNAEIAKTHAEKANYSNYSQGLPCAECDECCAGIPGI